MTEALNIREWLLGFDNPAEGLHDRATAAAALAELAELRRVHSELTTLIDQHTQPDPRIPGQTAEYHVAVAELRNILEPGSAPMYAEDWPAFTATCGICLPQGDGVHFHRGKSGARRPQ